MNEGKSILLTGLDGSNPLAFLAALGTLRTLTIALPDETVRMAWEQQEGAWRPRVWCSLASDRDALVGRLAQTLPSQLSAPWTADKRLPFSAVSLQKLMTEAATASTDGDRTSADLLAAFGSEVIADEKGNFADTSFRMVRSGDSAGQGFLYYACNNALSTTTEDIRTSIFDRWVYSDRGSSFRWDPAENKVYALQAGDPSDDGSLSVVGANRLALEALVLFPVHPTSAGAATTAFAPASTRSGLEFCWPIWTVPLAVNVMGSLLATTILHKASAAVRASMGVAAMFKSRQFKPNQYYRNFSPAQAV